MWVLNPETTQRVNRCLCYSGSTRLATSVPQEERYPSQTRQHNNPAELSALEDMPSLCATQWGAEDVFM